MLEVVSRCIHTHIHIQTDTQPEHMMLLAQSAGGCTKTHTTDCYVYHFTSSYYHYYLKVWRQCK